MLKQLRLNAELKQKRTMLEELKKQKEGFDKRMADLGVALDEATTDEDLNLVNSQIEELEKEINEADVDAKIKDIESEVNTIEGELEEIEKKGNSGTDPVPPVADTGAGDGLKERGNNLTMNRRGIFYGLSAERRSAILAQDDVKSFVERCREMKGQTRGVTGGELGIPEVLIGLLRDNIHNYSKLITKVNLKPVAGKARQMVAGTIPEAIWVEMVSSLKELELMFNQVEVDGYKVGGYLPVPNSVLEDSAENLVSEIVEMLAQAIGLGVDKAIIYGTGVKMPTGIVTRLAQKTKPDTWPTEAPAWKNLSESNILKVDGSLADTKFFAAVIKALSKCKANYSNGEKFWCMSTETYGTIVSKALTFNAAGAVVAGVNKEMPVVGGEIIILDFIPENDVIGGYGSLYLLAERAGMQLKNSDIPMFIQDQTVFKGTARYDGLPVIGEGFVALNINNAAPTTSVTFAGQEEATNEEGEE